MSPSPDRRIATARMEGIWAKTIIATASSGTMINAPTMPHSAPPAKIARKIASGLRFSDFPISRGSRKLLADSWTAARVPTTIKNGPKVSNYTSATSDGKTMPTSEPMVGTKLKKKITIAQKDAASTPTMLRTK